MWLLSFLAQTHQGKNDLDRPFLLKTLPSDIIWNKYPNRCPACFDFALAEQLSESDPSKIVAEFARRRDDIENLVRVMASEANGPTACTCLARLAFAEERHHLYRALNRDFDDLRLTYADELRRSERKRVGLRDLEDMFEAIFKNSYQAFSIQTIAFHLLEEVGEVTQALKDCYTFDREREPFSEQLRHRRLLKLEEEVADVFSWLLGLMLKIRHVYYQDAQEYFQTLVSQTQPVRVSLAFTEAVHLDDMVWAKYGRDEGGERSTLVCSGCGHSPCECPRDLRLQWEKVEIG